MKTVDTLKKELMEIERGLEEKKCKIDSLKSEVENLTNSYSYQSCTMERIKQYIENYKDYEKQQTKKDCHDEILDWLTGQREKTNNVGSYTGIVCPKFDIYRISALEETMGTNEKIKKILEEYNYDYFTVTTSFQEAGLYGDYWVKIDMGNLK